MQEESSYNYQQNNYVNDSENSMMSPVNYTKLFRHNEEEMLEDSHEDRLFKKTLLVMTSPGKHNNQFELKYLL